MSSYVVNFPQPSTKRSQLQKVWLSNCQLLATEYARNHVDLGSNSSAGYHSKILFPAQTATPTAVTGYNCIFSSGSALNIQTSANPSALQPITAIKVPASFTYSIPYPASGSGSGFRVNISTQPILGTPLQTVNIAILPYGTFNVYVTQAFNIVYALPLGTLTFSSLVSAISSTSPVTTVSTFPIWGMAQYNTVFSGTPSLDNVGAYLSSIVVYIDNKAMQAAKQGKFWTTTVTGVV